MIKTALSILFVSIACCHCTTDRFYSDLHVSSKSGRYRVDATSPDNVGDGYSPFQDDFTYHLIDTKTGDTIWTRKQPDPSEGSPVSISVSERGVTIIYTAYDQVMIVSPQGKIVNKIDFLKDALTKNEYQNYVHQTTAGPMWAGFSISYFFEHSSRQYYVIRPWWGRRVIIDVENGKLQKTNDILNSVCIKTEKEIVMNSLASKPKNKDDHLERCLPLYLAGALKIKEAIPYLRTAEKSTLSFSSTMGGLSWNENFDDAVDPHSYSTFSIRQIAQLSLRRLDETPQALPCHLFEITKAGESKPFKPKLKNKRHENVGLVKVGMPAKQILMLIGSPDFISYDEWSYDIDANPPFSLTIKMDARKSINIKRQKPIWLDALDRDEALAY